MAIDFPSSPAHNQVHTHGAKSWSYDNTAGMWLAVNAGVQGTQGTQGPLGIQGAQGLQGITGENGSQGTQGIQGLLGIQGAQGLQGITGAQGITGTQGTQGIQGTQGTQGIQGIQGRQGITGANGSNGTQGTVGSTGATGAQGTTGTQGAGGLTTTDATTLGGLSVHAGVNNEANKIVRTNGSGYADFGWINTISGDNGTTAINRIYASQDAYIRYYTPTNFRQVLDVPTRTGGSASGTWGINITGNSGTTSQRSFSGTLTGQGDVRAPIFYDTNDTSYYCDPNGTSELSALTAATRTRWDMPRRTFNRQAYIGTTSYWTGTRGWSDTFNWNQAWGYGFGGFDIWGENTQHPQGNGYIHGQGICSGLHHANDDGTAAYGWMLVGGTNASDRLWYRGAWGNSGNSWREIPMYDVNAYAGSMYAGIYYDANNTAFYTDPHSTSNLNALTTNSTFRVNNGWSYLANNYGYGVVGLYESTIYQLVFAMGDSYKTTAGGGINNLYGIAWSHPNAGGIAGNLDSHGLIVAINGGFGSCMAYSIKASGNVTAYSDERLKKNWSDLPKNYVEQLAQVKVGTYTRIDGEKLRQVGVSAQSLRPLLPEAVIEATDDFKTLSVAYGNAAMASAVELAKEVVSLKEQLAAVLERLNQLENK